MYQQLKNKSTIDAILNYCENQLITENRIDWNGVILSSNAYAINKMSDQLFDEITTRYCYYDAVNYCNMLNEYIKITDARRQFTMLKIFIKNIYIEDIKESDLELDCLKIYHDKYNASLLKETPIDNLLEYIYLFQKHLTEKNKQDITNLLSENYNIRIFLRYKSNKNIINILTKIGGFENLIFLISILK